MLFILSNQKRTTSSSFRRRPADGRRHIISRHRHFFFLPFLSLTILSSLLSVMWFQWSLLRNVMENLPKEQQQQQQQEQDQPIKSIIIRHDVNTSNQHDQQKMPFLLLLSAAGDENKSENYHRFMLLNGSSPLLSNSSSSSTSSPFLLLLNHQPANVDYDYNAVNHQRQEQEQLSSNNNDNNNNNNNNSNSNKTKTTMTFHRWNRRFNGIQIEPLWQYMQELVVREHHRILNSNGGAAADASQHQEDANMIIETNHQPMSDHTNNKNHSNRNHQSISSSNNNNNNNQTSFSNAGISGCRQPHCDHHRGRSMDYDSLYGPVPAWIGGGGGGGASIIISGGGGGGGDGDNTNNTDPNANQTSTTPPRRRHRRYSYTLRVAVQLYRQRRNVLARFEIIGPFVQRALFSLPQVQQQINHTITTTTTTTSDSHHHLHHHHHHHPPFGYLKRAIQEGGLPLIFLLDDFTGCLKDNYNYTKTTINDEKEGNQNKEWKGGHDDESNTVPKKSNHHNNSSMANVMALKSTTATTKTKTKTTIMMTTTVPFLTLSASPLCDAAFAIPSYTVMAMAKPTMDDWNVEFHQMDALYPWANKTRKAVWRGALSGTAKWSEGGSIMDIPRMELMSVGQNHPHLFDVALACQPQKCFLKRSWQQYVTWGNYMPLQEFQKYLVVIDVDGNSWSERFPRLLCMNSVVVKVQPEQVDYFWPTLEAGVHYVAADNLTHLVDVVRYALSPDNEQDMQRIVGNARTWCKHHMVVHQVQLDILSILNGYAEQLYKADQYWHRHIHSQQPQQQQHQLLSWEQMKFRQPRRWINKKKK